MKNDTCVNGNDEAAAVIQPAFLGYEAVIAAIGVKVSKKTLLRWESDGCFPKRVWLGGVTKAWPASDVRDWCEARRDGRRYVVETP